MAPTVNITLPKPFEFDWRHSTVRRGNITHEYKCVARLHQHGIHDHALWFEMHEILTRVRFRLSYAGMQMIAQMGKVVQDNYPESVKRSFIVNGKEHWQNAQLKLWSDLECSIMLYSSNATLIVFYPSAPGIFPMLWKMIRPLVTEDMKRKVCILGCTYAS